MSASLSPAAARRRIVFLSQKVVDIKVGLKDPELAATVGELFDHLVDHYQADSEKITGSLEPVQIIPQSGVLVARLSGSALMKKSARLGMLYDENAAVLPRLSPFIDVHFPLGLNSYTGPMDIQSIFKAVADTSVSDGGNVHNMATDIGILAAALRIRYPDMFGPDTFELVVASSGDPFEKMPGPLAARLREIIRWHQLEMPNRFAIQLPCIKGGANRLSITSEPTRSPKALVKLIESSPEFAAAFREAWCVVTADPIFNELSRYAQPPYAYVINSSTAFRPLVAAEAYSKNVILCQNKKEAKDVLRLLMVRAKQRELTDTKEMPFPSPVNSAGDSIDVEHLAQLDRSLIMFRRANPLYEHPEGMSFDYPISFDADGGLIVGAGRRQIAVFSTILSADGEKSLLDEFADPERTLRGEQNEVGAGDVVASCVTLWNTVDPSFIVCGKMRGDQSRMTDLVELAATLFVSIFSRVLGNLLIRTRETHLSNITPEKLGELADAVAVEAVKLADATWKDLHEPAFGIVERWGIKVVIWHPGQVQS